MSCLNIFSTPSSTFTWDSMSVSLGRVVNKPQILNSTEQISKIIYFLLCIRLLLMLLKMDVIVKFKLKHPKKYSSTFVHYGANNV